MRPLAQRAGVSVAVISSRIGSKGDLVERVVAEGHARDRAFFARWHAFAAGLGALDAAARAALANMVFCDWLDGGRRQAFLLIEMVHRQALLTRPDAALDRWLADAGAFWAEMLFGADGPAALALGYVLDEAGFALAAEAVPAYALLRQLCLQRFVGGVSPGHGAAPSSAIAGLIEALRPAGAPAAISADEKRQRIAACAARIIVSEGPAAVTHRSVADAAGVPASTIVYHFGARAALVIAGLHSVIRQYHAVRAAPVQDSGTRHDEAARGLDLVKATSLVALAGAREPQLLPDALDMRRRRGENITAADAAGFGLAVDAGFDRAAAQTMSIALFGMRMVALARGDTQDPLRAQPFAALAGRRARAGG